MSHEAALRTAEALLRLNGGRTVLLRMPQPPIAGDPAEELGLTTPTFNDIPLAPAVFRKAASTTTLLIAATAIPAPDATALFTAAAGVVIDEVTYLITNVVAEQCHGTPYCYALTLTHQTQN